MIKLFKLLSSISALSPAICIYLLKNELVIEFTDYRTGNFLVSASIYFIISLFVAWCCLFMTKFLIKEEAAQVLEPKPVEHQYIPTYLGYFLVVLGLDQNYAFVSLLLILLVVSVLKSQIFYFNILWIFMGYRFYEVKINNVSLFLITKREDLKLSFPIAELRRLNNFTFIER